MTLPQEITLDAELSALAKSGKESQNASAVADWKEAQAQLRPLLDQIEAILRAVEHKGGRARSLAEDEIVDIDETIAYFEKAEANLRDVLRPQIERAQQCKAEAFSLPVSRADRAQAIAMWDRSIDLATRALRAFRDFRWELLAFRAQNEDPGDAPVFDDPEELLKYLDRTK